MKIKTKLLTFIGVPIILLLTISFLVLITIVTTKLQKEKEAELVNKTDAITKQVEDLITTSAKSYLTAIGSKSNSTTNNFYEIYENRELSYDRSRELVLRSLTEYNFLKSGIVFVTDSMGRIIAHPDTSKIGTIAPVQAWIQRLLPNEKVFKEYDESTKNRIVYRIYNSNYDINICVSANTSDFLHAVDISELNKTFNTIKIGQTGYPFLLQKSGYTLTEPHQDDLNRFILEDKDIEKNSIYQRVLKNDKGLFTYKIKETNGLIKEKFVSYRTENHSELIIVLTGDTKEIFGIVSVFKLFILILGIVLTTLLIVIIYTVSYKVTIPIRDLTDKIISISHGDGDLTKRIKTTSNDEIGTMVENFNFFLDTLQQMVENVKESIVTTTETKDKIVYRVKETSAAVKKISANIVSIKNHTKQIGNDTSEELKSYVINSMDNIVEGSNKILKSMDKVTKSSDDLELYSEKLNRRVNRFTT